MGEACDGTYRPTHTMVGVAIDMYIRIYHYGTFCCLPAHIGVYDNMCRNKTYICNIIYIFLSARVCAFPHCTYCRPLKYIVVDRDRTILVSLKVIVSSAWIYMLIFFNVKKYLVILCDSYTNFQWRPWSPCCQSLSVITSLAVSNLLTSTAPSGNDLFQLIILLKQV